MPIRQDEEGKIKSEFDALGPQSKAGPRQHYGMDFYGLMKGEVLVIVDLFTREAILQWLPSRKQEQVAHTILRRVIFERGVPLFIRSDNAPELMKGVIQKNLQVLKHTANCNWGTQSPW